MTRGAALVRDAPAPDSSSPVRGRPAWSRAEIVAVALLTAAAALMAAWALDRASLWNDEGATWAISGHGFGDLLHVLRTSGGDRAAALYYVVAYGWMRVFGTTEIAMRSLSVVAAVAAIPPYHAVARRLLPIRAAVAATALLATSPFLLFYARDARTYAAAVLLVVLAALAFLRAVERGTSRAWGGFTAVAVVAVYTHWFALLVVGALYLSLLGLPSDPVRRQHARRSAVAIGVALVPIAVLVLVGSDASVAWVAPLNAAQLRSVAGAFTGAGWSWLQALLAAVACGGWFAARAWSRTRPSVPRVALWWFPLPVAATALVSITEPLFVSRYLIVALPGFILLLAAGTVALAERILEVAHAQRAATRATALVLAVLLVVLLDTHNRRSVWAETKGHEDWRAVTHFVAGAAGPGDLVIVFPSTAVSVFSYYARDLPGFAARTGPSWPPLPWDATFTRLVANGSVLDTPGLDAATGVWLIVRAPQGGTVRASVGDSPALRALETRLAGVYPLVSAFAPWTQNRTVYLLHWARRAP